ncbi:hypothetical protein [Gordonia aichiensis]|uniref:hypothetical protein n=1 Tax=Gordonia aichiensis TaxID=36820 RepID=UPI0032634D0B
MSNPTSSIWTAEILPDENPASQPLWENSGYPSEAAARSAAAAVIGRAGDVLGSDDLARDHDGNVVAVVRTAEAAA